jgi:hypothetical protein
MDEWEMTGVEDCVTLRPGDFRISKTSKVLKTWRSIQFYFYRTLFYFCSQQPHLKENFKSGVKT